MSEPTDLDALTMRVIDLERWRRDVDRKPLPACPWWCTDTTDGHRERQDVSQDPADTALYRTHSAMFGDGALAVVQTEVSDRGRVTLSEPPAIHIYVDSADTLAEGRRLAEAMTAAVGLLALIIEAPKVGA